MLNRTLKYWVKCQRVGPGDIVKWTTAPWNIVKSRISILKPAAHSCLANVQIPLPRDIVLCRDRGRCQDACGTSTGHSPVLRFPWSTPLMLPQGNTVNPSNFVCNTTRIVCPGEVILLFTFLPVLVQTAWNIGIYQNCMYLPRHTNVSFGNYMKKCRVNQRRRDLEQMLSKSTDYWTKIGVGLVDT